MQNNPNVNDTQTNKKSFDKFSVIFFTSIFLLVFITTALFVGYYVGTSSVLSSITEFNKTNNLESGHFCKCKNSLPPI